MQPQAAALMLPGGRLKFVGMSAAAAGVQIAYPAGAAPRDLAIVAVASDGTSGFTSLSTTSLMRVSWKALTAADLTDPPPVANTTFSIMLLYRGGRRVELASSGASSPPLILPGFDKNGARAFVSIARTNGFGLSTPAGFTGRHSFVSNTHSADLLSPVGYVNGAAVNWGGTHPGGTPFGDGVNLRLF